MASSCLFSPLDKNGKPYKALPKYKKALGAKTGSQAFLKALSPSFQERHRGKLVIDDQGVATLESAIKIPAMRKLIGFGNMRAALEREYNFTEVADTADNFKMLVNQAKTFNDSNKGYIAYPEKTADGIRNVVHDKNKETIKEFNDRYGSMILNDRLVAIFEPLGLQVGDLEAAEHGYSGIVDFSNAKEIAGQFINLIRVANNMEGQRALSEEFSHLIIRMLRDTPLVTRTINALSQNEEQMQQILGEAYQSYVEDATDENGVDYDSIAEECLGRILQRNLIDNTLQEESYFQKMWRRLMNYIKKAFKDFSASDISNAILEADQAMSNLAKNLLSGSMEIDRNDIKAVFSDDRMHHLEKSVDLLRETIENAIATESKKKKILSNDAAIDRASRKEENLKAILDSTPEGKLKGLINYAHSAVIDLGVAREALGKSKEGERNFAMLRGIRSTIQSYNDFIDQLGKIINSGDEELLKLIADTSIENKDHVTVTLTSAYRELAALYSLVKDKFKDVALDSVEEFFKPFFSVEGTFYDSQGKERTLRQLIEEANGDIGFVDRYLMTMSNSGDMLLQLFDEVVKKAKANARYSTIDDMQDITRLMLDAREKGVTDFSFLYERDNEGHKTGNYISEVNTGQYEKDKADFLRQLNEEYGINPTGKAAKEKAAKRKEWMKSHGRRYGTQPNPDMYHNPAFDRMTTAQKDVYSAFMKMKQKFDKRIPASKVVPFKAIQMRRTSQQRLLDSMTNPSQAFQNVREYIAKELTRSSDDDAIYGDRTGLRSFDGSEFKVLPVLYTHRLSNPEELTDDVFSALAAYAYSTNTYAEMDKVVDPLEIARGWISDPKNREVRETSGNRGLVEKLGSITRPIYKSTGSNIIAKLEDFMDSQVYMRYYADSDKTINFMGREIKAGKMVNKWLSWTSSVQLGFNWLANAANMATGAAMQNIEAACGHYFNAGELLKADGYYAKELMLFLPEIESKNPTSKLALFDQLFDIKQEFAGNIKERMNTLFEKLFGKSIAFLGQTCGDHWLYNRTAIAMCLRKKVKLKDGTVTSLWDALQVTDTFEGDSRVKKLSIDAVDAETGEKIDREYIRKYSAKINEVNHRLFGVYNTDDMVAAQRTAFGRAMLQYRQWIIPLFARRFQDRRYVEALGEYEEGYYRTALHVLAGLRNGMGGMMEVWEELDEPQKRNCYRAIAEMVQFGLIWAIANFVDFGKDDPDRVWALKFAEYMAQRELHELGNLTPSFTMGNEILKTIKSPAVMLNTTQSALNLVSSMLDPRDWNDEIQSGRYEGMSTLHRNILRAPFPILAPFNQLERFSDNIEEVTRYYARSYQ